MSVQLLDKTRKINKLLHNNHSSKVVFNDICRVMTDILDADVLVISKKGKVLGASQSVNTQELSELIVDEVGGFTEKLAVAFNDIDYCMKVRASNHLVVYNPYALLYHYESKSRGLEDTPEKVARFNREIKIFSERWPEILKDGDPYYNPNLTLRKSNFALRDLKKEKIGEPYHLEV